MYPPERQLAIRALLGGEPDHQATVARIGEELEVSAETVRRDLDVLERRGVLRRVHGGAQLLDPAPFERALTARHGEQYGAKLAIAARVAAELPADGVVLLDSGSLTLHCALAMPKDRPLSVVTNNLPAARYLTAFPPLSVITLPGTVRGITSASVDSTTVERLGRLSVDLAVLGVNGLTPGLGLSTTNPEEAAVKRAMLLSARRRLVPVISGRIGRNSFCRFAEVSEVDLVLTDDAASPELLDALSAEGPDVFSVSVTPTARV